MKKEKIEKKKIWGEKLSQFFNKSESLNNVWICPQGSFKEQNNLDLIFAFSNPLKWEERYY